MIAKCSNFLKIFFRSWVSTFFISATFFMLFVIVEQSIIPPKLPGNIAVTEYYVTKDNLNDYYLSYMCNFYPEDNMLIYRKVECDDDTAFDLPTQRIAPTSKQNVASRYIKLLKHEEGTLCIMRLEAEWKPALSLKSHIYQLTNITVKLD